ncbi:unnamed protein product [Prorocentrum cordatum]|uniref:Uncharacterized protein n=1 Tax=Prorocentrum cordatum TaxID=2364126 RepID=A0ABN9W415_9DINO|nr:unnamed protein product [Polarella glacialis]
MRRGWGRGEDHFLGDPDVLHAAALAMGIAAIGLGKRLPQLLAAVSATTLGIYVGLVVQNRQHFDEPVFGTVDLPDGVWLPIVLGVVAGAAAGVLAYLTWRMALVLLTGGVVMLLALAICRLFNVPPERIFRIGASLLSAYRVVGAVMLIVAIIGSVFFVRRFHKGMVSFASANLGTLLLLSGVSYFAQKAGAEAPFSLLDDLARILSEVRGGRCHLWEASADGQAAGEAAAPPSRLLRRLRELGDDPGLHGCDCAAQCRSEISAWIASTVAVLAGRRLLSRQERRRKEKKREKKQEENQPLARSPAAQSDASPEASVIGNRA